ncbi:MAG: glycosyltransferase family 2 protein [Candidatus Delongbacteria bacterium]|nr:glycosyltransferase family 2 protein [Candidatus Delongbacteria bacterium]
MESVQVSFSIINYYTWEFTRRCLLSIPLYIRDIRYEIIVIDNTPADGEGQVPLEFSPDIPPFRIIRNHTNRGFGYAHNQAGEIAQGDYLLVLNNDTELLETTGLDELINYMDQHPNVGVMGVMQLNQELKSIGPVAFGKFPNLIQIMAQYLLNRLPSDRFIHEAGPYHSVAHLNGAWLLFRKSVFGEVQGFSPEFFLYFEDTDICYKLYKKGYRVVYSSNHSIRHAGGESAAKAGSICSYWKSDYANYFGSLIIFMRKNRSYISGCLTRYIVMTGFLLRWIGFHLVKHQPIKAKGYWILWKTLKRS